MVTTGRRVRAALLAAAVVATTAAAIGGGPTPASAQAEPAPGPAVTVTPGSPSDTDEVEVTTTGLDGVYLFLILQCAASALDDLPGAYSGPCIYLAVRRGRGTEDTATVRLSGAFTARNGDLVRCGVEPDDCAIVAWSSDGWQAGTAIRMYRSPAVPVRRSQEAFFPIDVIVTAPIALTDVLLAQCALPVGDALEASSCSPPVTVFPDAEGHAIVPFALVSSVGDPPQPCGDGNCGVALFDATGFPLGPGSPVTVLPDDGPPRLSSEGVVGAHDGDLVQVDLAGLLNEPVHLAQCAAADVVRGQHRGGPCTTAQSLAGDPDIGGATLWVTLERSFTGVDGSSVTCADTDDCVLALASDHGNFTSLAITWDDGVSPAQLAAAPSSGLVDGQLVDVTWSGAPLTYDGPPWWFLHTGAWAVGQCGAGVLDDTSVANVFRQCTTPPGAGPVTITEPDGGTSFEVQATIQPAIGGPIDCTAGPEACVAVLGRVEQDASVTLLSSPLTFA